MIEDWAPSVTSATKPRYSVVVPVYNEGANIGAFCAEALAKLPPNYELLICYDFDADNTVPALEALPADAKPPNVRLVRNRLGRGVRWAIDAGMRAAEADIVLVTMADLSDDFSNVEAMLQKAEAGADVVCASRYMKGGQQIGGPKFKKFLSRTAGLTLKWFAGMPTHDPTNSFKAYRREFLQKTPIESQEGFALGIELTVKAHIAGRKVEEVPATWRDRTAGQSRFKLMKWIPMYLRWYWLAMRKAWAGNAFWFSFLAITYLFMLTVFVPAANGNLPGGELDSSWVMVLHWTHAHHVDFGKDLVFTFGPWGFILQGYTPQTYAILFAAWTLIGTAFFAGAMKISRQLSQSAWVRGIWLLVLISIAGIGIDQVRDVRLFSPTCIAFLLYAFVDDLELNPTTVLLMAATAMTSQVKFSSTLMTLAVLGIITIDQLRRKKRPWALGLYLLSYLALWMFVGQSLGSLPAYFSASMAVASGYAQGEGFSRASDARDVTWFVICTLPILVTVIYAALRGEGKWPKVLAPFLGLSMLIFVTFKAGYVRHDEHGMEGTTSLAVVGLLVMGAVWRRIEDPIWKTVATVGAIAPIILAWQSFYAFNFPAFPGEIAETFQLAPSRTGTAASWMVGKGDFPKHYQDQLEAIRRQRPIPPIKGTVDIFPWNQNIAIAYGLNYRPRPVFQSYLAYTPALEKLNADFLAGPRAPDTILWTLGFIDGHYPPMEDALSWPEILTHYDLKSANTSMLQFERSSEARSYSLTPIGEPIQGEMGRPIDVPASDEPIWVRINVKPTLAGRLANFLLRPPWLDLRIRTGLGDIAFHLMPENAAAGFLLSPMIVEPRMVATGMMDHRLFAVMEAPDWATRLASDKVANIMVSAEGKDPKTACYQDQFDVSFERLSFPHRDISQVPGMRDYMGFQDFQMSVEEIRTNQTGYKATFIPLGGQQALFAPPRTTVQTRVPPACDHVRIRFGVLERANQNLPANAPPTDGVDFRIDIPQPSGNGQMVARTIWHRYLDPDHNPADRGMKEEDVIIGPQDKVILETAPGPKNVSGLSYWAGAEFHQ